VRCLVRRPGALRDAAVTTDIVQGDCLDECSLDRALVGVRTAYYLVHSMATGAEFAAIDRQAAERFGRAARRASVRRIIYLGGLSDVSAPLSAHLRSRNDTGDVLRASGVPVIELRASIVIGAGGLSFEMIRALVERLPVMICPRWVATQTQPIAIDDVLAYLEEAAGLRNGPSGTFEIGGRDVVSYGDMMREYARQRGLRRWLLPVPLLTPRLSGLWLALVTPAQARVGRALVEGLKNSTVVRDQRARDIFSVEPRSLRDALAQAIEEGAPARQFVDSRTTVVSVPPARAFLPIRKIGGMAGWYFGNVLWRARGVLDVFLGGPGMARGRSNPEDCAVGDVIDGWTVDAYEPNRRLHLSLDLKLPGRGWLELDVAPLAGGSGSVIRQTATFDPRGLLCRLYWYVLFPVHVVMFRGMLAGIARRATVS